MKYSTLIHFVSSKLPPTGENLFLEFPDCLHRPNSLPLAPGEVRKPHSKLFVQSRIFRRGAPPGRGNHTLIRTQGDIFHYGSPEHVHDFSVHYFSVVAASSANFGDGPVTQRELKLGL